MDQTQAIFDKFRVLVGQEIAVGDWFTIEQDRIDAFAKVTGDEQWIHVDPDRAKTDSPYGTTVAHGFLTLSLLPYLTKGNDPETFAKDFPGMRIRVNYGLNKVRFPSPVKCGARVRARTMVSSVDIVDGGLQLVFTMTVDIQDETKPACVAEQIFRLYP